MKTRILYFVAAVILFSCIPSQESFFEKDGVSFTVPRGWVIYKEEVFPNGTHQVSIKKEGIFANAIKIFVWFDGNPDLEKYLLQQRNYHQKNSPQEYTYGNIVSGEYGKFPSLSTTYHTLCLDQKAESEINVFHANGKTISAIRTELIADKAKNKEGFDLIESSFDVDNVIKSMEEKCDNYALVGSKRICLPAVDGFKECLDKPIVREFATMQELQNITTLALYLNNETYDHLDNLFDTHVEDYFKIYTTNYDLTHESDMQDLIEMEEHFTGIYETYELFEERIQSVANYIILDKPVIIDQYETHSNARTFVQLIKYRVDAKEWVGVSIINILLTKDRLIWLAYYKHYQEPDDIKLARSKNDYMVHKIFDVNKY